MNSPAVALAALAVALIPYGATARVVDGHVYGEGVVTVGDPTDLFVQELLPPFPSNRTIYLEVSGADIVWTEWGFFFEWQMWWRDFVDGKAGPLVGNEYEFFGSLFGNDEQSFWDYRASSTLTAGLATFHAADTTNYHWDCGLPYKYGDGQTCAVLPFRQEMLLYGFRVETDQPAFSWKVYDTTQSVVPEPRAWALLILGLGAVGAALRRVRAGARPAARPG